MKLFNQNKSIMLNFINSHIICIISFLIPLLTMITVLIIKKVTPFGDNSLMILDGLNQYIPFFSELYNKLKHGGNFFYSWNAGMGYNFLGLWSYYLSSPFNFIIIFFKQENLNTALSLIIILKIASTSLAMSIYLAKKKTLLFLYTSSKSIQEVSNPKDIKIVVFSIAYALSMYVCGYYWNIMWLDCLMILPVILLGLDHLMLYGDGRLYCLALFYSLFCNYYLSFMTCLFLVLCFFCCRFSGIWDFIKKGFRFLCYSILAAGMASVVLIPAYKNIMLTASAQVSFPKWEYYQDFWQVLSANILGAIPVTVTSLDGAMNIYCGLSAIFLVLLSVAVKEIPIILRIKNILLIVLFILSFNVKILNYIWHGFHDQYGIPNRFSYLYIFILLVIAYETIQHIKSISTLWIVGMFFILTGGFTYVYFFIGINLNVIFYVLTIIALIFYMILFILMKKDKSNKIIKLIFITIASIEIIGSSLEPV